MTREWIVLSRFSQLAALFLIVLGSGVGFAQPSAEQPPAGSGGSATDSSAAPSPQSPEVTPPAAVEPAAPPVQDAAENAEAQPGESPQPSPSQEPESQATEVGSSDQSVGVASTEGEVSTPDVQPQSDAEEDALLAELEAELEQENQLASSTMSKLELYGFTDLTFGKYFINKNSPLRSQIYDYSSFFIGRLNLYLRGDLGNGWRSLAEVRFSYLPNGDRTVVGGEIQRTDTHVFDYATFGRARPTGSILIERAWLEYTAHSLLTIRAGQWLTPYGIWNVDHGTPTIIPVARPYVIGLELLPERQVGIQAYGRHALNEDWSLGYVAGLSNGRAVIEYADLDENKAFTGRIHAIYRGYGTLELGATTYFGRYTDLRQKAIGNGVGIRVVDDPINQYDELSFGADLRWIVGGFHFQAEALSNQVRYTDQGRLARTAREFYPDYHNRGGYAVLGYRMNWLGLMPYLSGEYFKLFSSSDPGRPPKLDLVTTTGAGLNSRPTANVTLKAEVNAGFFPGDHLKGSSFEYPIWAIQTQAAWAF